MTKHVVLVQGHHNGGSPRNKVWVVYLNNMRLGYGLSTKAEAETFARNVRECLKNAKPRP